MVRYPYRCPETCSCQRFGRGQEYEEVHSIHDEPQTSIACPDCDLTLRRVYTSSHLIMRPDGWGLRPDDKGYWNFNRQQELGQLRGASERGQDFRTVDETLNVRPEVVMPELPIERQREIYELGKIVDRNIRESSDIPEFTRED